MGTFFSREGISDWEKSFLASRIQLQLRSAGLLQEEAKCHLETGPWEVQPEGC